MLVSMDHQMVLGGESLLGFENVGLWGLMLMEQLNSRFYARFTVIPWCWFQRDELFTVLCDAWGSDPLLSLPSVFILQSHRQTNKHAVLTCFSRNSPENSQERCTQTAFPGLSSSLWPPSHKTIYMKKKTQRKGGKLRNSPVSVCPSIYLWSRPLGKHKQFQLRSVWKQ